MYALHNDEKETILLFNMTDGYWGVSTSIPAHMNKFKQLGWELVNDNGYELTFKVPKNAIQFRNPSKLRRELTEEQRAELRERFEKIRKTSKV